MTIKTNPEQARYDRWHKFNLKVYAEQVKQGFKFQTNVSLGDQAKYVRQYEALGLEVFVGDKAFDLACHDISEEHRAILTRQRLPSTAN
jgi:hypothetical protein